MGLFDKLFGRSGNVSSSETMEEMLSRAVEYIDADKPALAVDLYQRILRVERTQIDALYNLGSLYAQGKGVTQDYLQAAKLFHRAERAGNEHAGKLSEKCLMDFMHQRMDHEGAASLYDDVVRFIDEVWRGTSDVKLEANRRLFALAGLHFNRKEYAPAAKLFRPAAEFGDDGLSQNFLAVLYNAGEGVEKNDLAALYWFDRAVDNGVDAALTDRDGILNAYRANLSADEFRQEMLLLSDWCADGAADVPKDEAKSARWRELARA